MEKEKKSLNILIVGGDWKNIFEEAPADFRAKLERDCLEPDLNNFFYFAWSTKGYFSERGKNLKTIHVKTRWQKFKPFTDFLALFLVPLSLKKYNFKPDVVLVYDLGYAPLGVYLRSKYRSRVVLAMLNMPRIYSATRTYALFKLGYSIFLEKAFWRFFDFYYTINQTMRDYLVGLGAPKNKIFIFASNTITRDIPNIKNSRKGLIRQKYDLKPDQRIILSIGRMEAEKGYPELLKLFSQLDKKFVLIILGRGSLMDEFKRLTEDLGVAERVIFGGYINRQEIWNFYLDADLFWLLSKAEALGLVFWEAMYMGVPVIGSTAEGIVETIGKDGDRGFIFDSKFDNIGTLKNKIDFCLTESQEKTAMLKRAKDYVDEQIANDITINDVVGL